MQQEKALLPRAYRQVEYIETTKTQYIDTGVVPNENTRTFCDFQYTKDPVVGDYDFAVFGSRYSYNIRAYYVSFRGSHDESIYGMNGAFRTNRAFNDTERHTVDFSNNAVYVDNIYQFAMGIDAFTGEHSVFLGAVYQPSNVGTIRTSEIKIYSAKMYQDDILIRDYIPCYRKSDGVIGMYDLVNNEFYTNAGTGEFLKGGDV